MKKVFAAFCFVALSGCSEPNQSTEVEAREPVSYEMPRTQIAPIQDSKTDRQYELYIKLPEGYSDNTDIEYPVIYTTDAVWHFDMLSGATEYLMPDVILVGISWQKDLDAEEEFTSRFRDYTVTEFRDPENQAKYQGGQASNHLSFIRDDVIKYIENNYRTDSGERTYLGYSLGGAFGAYALLAEPDTFKNYILGSPALGKRSAKYIDELEAKMAAQQQELNANAFVSIGELEESEMGITEDLLSVLQRRSQSGLTITGLEIIEDSDHGGAFPETIIRGVKWLSQLKSE
ncbi:MAG: alpha/beta hydrolase-fold protein [Pseudomonadota bacterium]